MTSSETAPTERGRITPEAYSRMDADPRFVELRRRFRNFVFPMTVAFLAWYLLYVVLSAFGRGFMDTKVVGHRWSARSFEVRDFLARNRVPYRWYAATDPEGERLLAAAQLRDCLLYTSPSPRDA